jgi:1-phosphofructokinase
MSLAVFAPNPILTVTLELEGGEQRIHFHAGGQGVWVSEMAQSMGCEPILCGLLGGEPGELLRPLLQRVAGPGSRLLASASASGCYVTDRRSGEREVLAARLSDPPSRHEFDELLSVTCAEGIAAGWLVVTNPLPADALPLEAYGDLVADARAGGCRTLVDLSTPRLDSALEGEPDLVKINDWELAEFVVGPVSTPGLMLDAAKRVQAAGARNVVITRGEQSALLLDGSAAWQLSGPRFTRGFREGCGDAMMGALAAVWAGGESLERAVVLGAAAGAANFLRRGIGHSSREVVERLAETIRLEPWPVAGIDRPLTTEPARRRR